MSSQSSRMDWQHGGPPPPHRSGYSPYDSPSPYESHPPHAQGTPPYGGYHGGHGPPPSQQHPSMMPPRGSASGPPPHDYWSSYEHPPPPGAPRRGPPPHSSGWRGGPPSSHDSPGAPYDHRMAPPPQYQQHGYPPYPPAPHRHHYSHPPPPAHPHHPHPPASHSMGPGRPRDGRPYMPRDLPVRGQPPVARTPPRSNMKATPAFSTPVKSTANVNKSTPLKDEKELASPPLKGLSTPKGNAEVKKIKGKGKNGKGDPLSLLAKVCKQETENEPAAEAPPTPATPAPVPTSPLPAHRRLRPSPVVTPASTPMGKPPMMPHPQISPVDHTAEGGYWASEPNPERYPRRSREAGPYPPPSSNRQPTAYGSGPPPPSTAGPAPPPTPGSSYPEWPNESPSPALVERGSFDSVEGQQPPGEGHAPGTPYDSRRGPPPGPYHYGGEYSRGPPPHMAPRKYPPPRWSSYPPSDPSMHPPPYPPQHEGQPPMEYPPHYQSVPPPYGEGPPHSHAGRPPYPPPHSQHSYPPSHHHHHPHAPPHYGGGPPTPMMRRDGPPSSMAYAPYTYVQQPHLEEKTVLRKKFSWKHYPELERFLIANRDEYLKHSNMNYTAEQKQYNNWLTERLLEVAAEHHYAFDPEDFNFVAIRDRIRCYYKSYVQTARKRGLSLPSSKTEAGEPAAKKAKTQSASDAGEGEGGPSDKKEKKEEETDKEDEPKDSKKSSKDDKKEGEES